jgi:hypothetical protein
VWDFFIAAAFANDPDYWAEHVGDARFRGAYLRIAETWDPESAKKVRDHLNVSAAESGDHSTSDEFIKRLEKRLRAKKPKPASAVPGGLSVFPSPARNGRDLRLRPKVRFSRASRTFIAAILKGQVRVDLICSPSHRRMSGVCAFRPKIGAEAAATQAKSNVCAGERAMLLPTRVKLNTIDCYDSN